MEDKKTILVLGAVILLVFSTAPAVVSGHRTYGEQSPLNRLIEETSNEVENDQTLDSYPFPEEYPSVDDLYDWYDDLESEYPDIVEKHHYGESWEGRDLWALEITSDEDTVVDEKPTVLIDGALHAREWSTIQTSAYFMWRLVDEYETNETINWLVNNREIFVIPMTNPDGYIYDGDGDLGDDGMGNEWRKNRNESVGDEDDVGTDLNRNWDISWEDGDDDPRSSTYRGEEPFSEPETKNLRDFILDNDVDSYQNTHSHADCLLIPYMHTEDPSPHDDWYRDMGDDMTSFTSLLGDESQQYSVGQPHEEIGYSAPGGASDWAYAKEGLQGFTFELHTPDDGMEGFYPDEEYIMTINEDVDDSLFYQSRVADVDLGDGPMSENGENLYPPNPYLVYGEVEDDGGDPISGIEVEVESQVTGESLTIDTDSNGYYEFNFGNLVDQGYDIGDDFTIGADPESEVDFTVDDTWGERIDLEVSDVSVPPDIFTLEASDITEDSATLEGEVDLGDVEEVDAYFQYRIEDDSEWQETEQYPMEEDGIFTDTVENLEQGTTYEYRAVAEWNTEIEEGEIETFTTLEELGPPPNLEVAKEVDTDSINLEWDDAGAPEYNVYYSEDQYDDLENWDLLTTVEESSYTHEGALGGENYYLVTSSDGQWESDPSNIGFSVERHFGDEKPRHYVSIPTGFEDHTGDGELTAADLVTAIEGDLETSEHISEVLRWDYLSRDHDDPFYYDEGVGEWIDDFEIEPGDGIALTVEDEFDWHITGRDIEHEVTYGDERPRHYTSIPYTLADQTGDGELRASDIVTMIEGDLESSEYISDVVRWDPANEDHDERFHYDDFSGEWVNDFAIEPGDGIGFSVENEFTWEIELIELESVDDTETSIPVRLEERALYHTIWDIEMRREPMLRHRIDSLDQKIR